MGRLRIKVPPGTRVQRRVAAWERLVALLIALACSFGALVSVAAGQMLLAAFFGAMALGGFLTAFEKVRTLS